MCIRVHAPLRAAHNDLMTRFLFEYSFLWKSMKEATFQVVRDSGCLRVHAEESGLLECYALWRG